MQKWGNNLAVRIPAAVARSARLSVGQPVEVCAQVHGGEAIASDLVGAEKL